MAEEKEGYGKIVRTTLESLKINVANEELKYRSKYLPDPKRLSNDKIVCTVCSVSLASRVRRGKQIFIHAILGVLVCKDCHDFYGDGIFSTDEDGDDKYCRWCGQGGTLYLCSKCNCGFCKKCMMKNMKNSALQAIEDDDWKCLICVPRPIFGSRAVCWASQELNYSVRKNDLLRLRLEEEKNKLEAEKKLNGREEDNSHVKIGNNTKKRVHDTDDSDSSTVFIPVKKKKTDIKTKKSLNGSIKKHRRKDGNSHSENSDSDDDQTSKLENIKCKIKNNNLCSSSEESSSSFKNERKKKNSKKKSKHSSSVSSDSEETISKSRTTTKSDSKTLKRKKKKKSSKRTSRFIAYSSSSESMERPKKKKNKCIFNLSLSDAPSEEDKIKCDNKESRATENEEQLIGDSDNCREAFDNYKDINVNNEKLETSEDLKLKASSNDLKNEISRIEANQSSEKSIVENAYETLPTEIFDTNSSVLVSEQNTLENIAHPAVSESLSSSHQIHESLNCDEYTLSYHESTSFTDENLPLSQEDEVKVKVDLAIEWLDVVSSDIADLGSLIAERANKFEKKKLNLENLCSYEDVLLALGKLKKLIGGVHSNYKQIEDSLDDKLKSWKILAGLEKADPEEQCLQYVSSLYDAEENEMQSDDCAVDDNPSTKTDVDLQVDNCEPEVGNHDFAPIKVENELISENDELSKFEEDKNISIKVEHSNENEGSVAQDIDSKEPEPELDQVLASILDQDIAERVNESKEADSNLFEKDITVSENVVTKIEGADSQELLTEDIDGAIVKAELILNSRKSNMVWSGLLSSDDDSDLNDENTMKQNSNFDNEGLTTEDNHEPALDQVTEEEIDSLGDNQTLVKETDTPVVSLESNKTLGEETAMESELLPTKEAETAKEDTDNFEALQELLYSSTEPEMGSSESDSNDSDDIQLDDSDLDEILKPRKVVVKKSTKQREPKVKEVNEKSDTNKEAETDAEEDKDGEEKNETEKKVEEPLDSEAEIDMLTDLSKLKKKTILRRVQEEESSGDSSSEDSQDDDGSECNGEEKKRRKKYRREIKKKREQERNELFGFLKGDSSAEDEVDITKDDLDVIEERYASENSNSMSLEAFSRKMTEKWRELEKEQDQLNLQRLLASESEQGSDGDDLVLDSDEDKKKKKKEKKINDGKPNEDKANVENEDKEETELEVKQEKAEIKVEKENEDKEPEEEYEQFMEDLSKSRRPFTGLGSSSEEDKGEEEVEIKDEPLSDGTTKVKKEPKGSDDESGSNSDSSSDVFLDLSRKSSKKIWKQHKLLRIKLSDTDTSDEERYWKRRLEREEKKNTQGGDSPKKSHNKEKKKGENESDKENKRIKREKRKEEEEANSSSTLEMSDTDSSGSEIFKKKKKKKKDSSGSDVMILSDADKKKKKKKKRLNLSGDSSDESGDSDSDIIDITQKSSQGESPGKGGRKNIRKVKTKHELAAATKAAAKEEEERKKRIAARQKLYNDMFEIKEAEVLEKLVLDFDPETKTELISVDRDLVTKMKPHQAKGVKFMWDSCFESLSQLKTKKGSGCILAHCMGLGKTFQVVSLVHTILSHKDTNVQTVLVVCPLSTVLNWYNEFEKWLEDVDGGRKIKVYHLTKFKKAHERSRQLSRWHQTGGVMILGYEMFRILANPASKKFRLVHTEVFQKTLIDPGADLVVCDEGHMLKNESTLLSKAMSRIRTLRRIVLTGTPMQNNLKEYHCMVQFVKPNLLGTRKEFLNQFVNPITNGQFVDSTEADVKVMKRRAHVLHKMLEGLVQRFDYSVLTPFLPPKHEYVISLRLSDIQVKLYQFYLDYFCQKSSGDKRTSSQLFQDWQVLGRIWTHPRVLKMSYDKMEKERQKQESEDEGSMKDFINDKSASSSLSLSSSSSGDESGENKDKTKRDKSKKDEKEGNKQPEKIKVPISGLAAAGTVDEINLISSEEEDENKKDVEVIENQKSDTEDNENKAENSNTEDKEGETDDKPSEETTEKIDSDDGGGKENKENENDENKVDEDDENKEDKTKGDKEEKIEKEKQVEAELLDRRGDWWKNIIEPEHFEDINQSAKLILLFAILKLCEMIEDKCLVFSQSLFSLDLIEYFLEKVDQATEEHRLDESLGNHAGCWQKGLDYFRLDGSSSSESRSAWCKSFNREDNPRARLFLISTRAGGLGINLTGANRVVIFDASWNPSHDIQSIFRIYRFGQKKPCYVYRFVAQGTMEEKVYERQVAKQLLSSRVVDEQQVQRHFSMNDLNELYMFTPPQREEKPTPVLPKDKLMAELLTQYNDWIEKYHEHDSLLENIADEELNEEERKLAWEDYENEKKRGFPTTTGPGGAGFTNFPAVANQIELFRKSLKLKFPTATDAEMNAMLQTLMYQVNYRAVSQQVGAQQQPGQQGAGPSQQHTNFRNMNQTFQSRSLSMNQVYQNSGFRNQPINQQRVGSNQVNQQQQRVVPNQMTQQRTINRQIVVNQQRIGNGEIRKSNNVNNRTSQEIYSQQMRQQQDANLLRIQNQNKFQQNTQQITGRQQAKVPTRQTPAAVQLVQNLPGRSPWTPNQQPQVIPNKMQQMQKQRSNAVKILNQRPVQSSSIGKPGASNVQPQLRTMQQKQQEVMRRRIEEMQRKKNQQTLQQKVQPQTQKGTSMGPLQQKQLEEMKKRYNAQRMKKGAATSNTPISIVELDDEPGT